MAEHPAHTRKAEPEKSSGEVLNPARGRTANLALSCFSAHCLRRSTVARSVPDSVSIPFRPADYLQAQRDTSSVQTDSSPEDSGTLSRYQFPGTRSMQGPLPLTSPVKPSFDWTLPLKSSFHWAKAAKSSNQASYRHSRCARKRLPHNGRRPADWRDVGVHGKAPQSSGGRTAQGGGWGRT